MKYIITITLLTATLLAKSTYGQGSSCDYTRPGITLNCAQSAESDLDCDLVVIGADGSTLCDTGPDSVSGACCTTPGGHTGCINDVDGGTSNDGDPIVGEDGTDTHHVDQLDCSDGLQACQCWYYDTVNWT